MTFLHLLYPQFISDRALAWPGSVLTPVFMCRVGVRQTCPTNPKNRANASLSPSFTLRIYAPPAASIDPADVDPSPRRSTIASTCRFAASRPWLVLANSPPEHGPGLTTGARLSSRSSRYVRATGRLVVSSRVTATGQRESNWTTAEKRRVQYAIKEWHHRRQTITRVCLFSDRQVSGIRHGARTCPYNGSWPGYRSL
ncbi:hypothetical protein BC828DRAFT_212460 [Blastocladiella britannica]|nr:hypothetical protein BC828DRAFT_212460 [Blastocladiella britannica]